MALFCCWRVMKKNFGLKSFQASSPELSEASSFFKAKFENQKVSSRGSLVCREGKITRASNPHPLPNRTKVRFHDNILWYSGGDFF